MVANVVSTPATFRPPFTTLFHRRAITSPKAVASEVEMVFRTSAIEILRSSAIANPDARWRLVPKPFPEANKYRSAADLFLFLRDHPDILDAGRWILAIAVLLEGFHHVPDRQQGDRDAIERLHLHARLVGGLDIGRHDDSIRAHVERHARGGNRNWMGVRKDLPHGLHSLKRGDLCGGDGISLLDATSSDRADRRGPEPDGTGGHGAPVHVRLPPDVDHLRHDGRRCAPRARKAVVKSRCRTQEGLSTMPGPLDGSVRMGCA